MLNIRCDLDGTLCDTNGIDYVNATPRCDDIRRINQLYDEGNHIIIWTARGSKSGIDWLVLTKHQLAEWGVKYHELRLDKPFYDTLIDDRAYNSMKDFVEK